MEYLNPFTLLDLNPDTWTGENQKEILKQEKKRLLAEFELHDAHTIEVEGKILDKATLLKLFDHLEDSDAIEVHRQIALQPSLLAFLEDASLDYFFNGDITLLSSQSDAFLAFIGPFYADQFNKRLFHAFRQMDWEEIQAMCRYPLAIPVAHHVTCFKDTYRSIHSKSREISQMASAIAEGGAPGADIQDVCDELLILSLNHLPEYFGGSRDKYGLALEELAIAVHNAHRRVQLGIFILRQGLKLNISQSTASRLNHVLDQLKELAPAESIFETWTMEGGSKNKTRPWWLVVGGAAVVYIILKTIGLF